MINIFRRILLSLIMIFFCVQTFSQDFSERKNINKILKGFYKNNIFDCNYINKSWSTGFNDQPYGMVKIMVHSVQLLFLNIKISLVLCGLRLEKFLQREALENTNFGRKLKMINLSLFQLIFLTIRLAQI